MTFMPVWFLCPYDCHVCVGVMSVWLSCLYVLCLYDVYVCVFVCLYSVMYM